MNVKKCNVKNWKLALALYLSEIFFLFSGTINGTGNIQTNISNTGNILQRGPAPASVNRMPYPGTPTSRIQASIPNRPSPPRGMSPSPVRPPAVRQQASVKPAQVVDLTRLVIQGPRNNG